MKSAIQQYPRFEKGSPSTEYQQIVNFCVNYFEGMLIGLIHMDIPAELETQAKELKPLQQRLASRERTVRHAFQFQLEKFFSDFRSISPTRLRVSYASNVLSDYKISRIMDFIQSISEKHQDLHKTQLQTTAKRLKSLVHRADDNSDDNPISPFNLCRAFLASIETLNLPTQKNRLLFELFDHTLDDQLNNFYNQIDLGLYHLDILADLTDSSLFKLPEKEAESRELIEQNELENNIESALQNSSDKSDKKSTVTRKEEDQKQPVTAPEETKITISSLEKQRIKTLENQKKLEKCLLDFKQSTENGSNNFVSTFSHLSGQISLLVNNKQRKDILKFSHYFTSLLNSSLLSIPLKTQLSRLSSPLLKMVLTDPFFFRSSSHPVNDFIQSIIDFELRFKHEGDSLAILSRAIDKLLKIDNPTLSDYQPLIDHYEAVIELEIIRLEKIKEEKNQQEEILKKEILELTNTITEELVVDRETMQFFYDDWQLLLLHLAHNSGKTSSEFKNSVNIAKMLSWFLDHNKKGAHPRFESTTFKSLLTSIEIGLVTLNFSSEHRHRIRKQLVKEYKQANEERAFSFIPVPSNHLPVPQKNRGKTEVNLDKIDNKYFEMAKNLNMGEWVEIKTSEKAAFKRAKLKWKAADYSLFIFMDQRGHKIKECEFIEVAYEFSINMIRLIKKPDPNRLKSI